MTDVASEKESLPPSPTDVVQKKGAYACQQERRRESLSCKKGIHACKGLEGRFGEKSPLPPFITSTY